MVAIISYILLVVAIVLALWRGGGPERVFVTILTTMFLLDRAGHVLLADRTEAAFDHLHLVIDQAAFAAMVGVSLKARRYWPLWASSCQLISLFTNLGWAIDTRLPQGVYLAVGIAPSYLISSALIWGTLMHWRRLARRGADPSWRGS